MTIKFRRFNVKVLKYSPFWCYECCTSSWYQGHRSWQPSSMSKKGHKNCRQARIYDFRDKCVVFACKDTINFPEKAMKISHFNHIMIELCYFSLDQWEIKIHLLWGKCFNIPHWLRSHSTNGRLQHIEELSESKTRVGMVWFKWVISRQMMASLLTRDQVIDFE